MKSIALITNLSLSSSAILASGHVLARKAPSLEPRVSFQGGWPIEANTCPSNTTDCQPTGSCCPNSTFCYTDGLAGVAVCCPDTSDCYETANTVPVCADPSWTLYIGNYNYFCCSSGQIGILPDKSDDVGSGLCVEDGTDVASTALATLYSGAAAGTATSTASAAVSSSATASAASTTQTMDASGTSSFAPKIGGSTSTGTSTGPNPTSTLTGSTNNPGSGKTNDSAKSGSTSIIGIMTGFLLLTLGM